MTSSTVTAKPRKRLSPTTIGLMLAPLLLDRKSNV